MPIFEHEGARIHYEVHGDGSPVLAIAPGGLRSRIEAWGPQPWNPIAALAGDYKVIAMDQRNAGASWAPISKSDSWSTYTTEQLALLDHLGVDRFQVVGMCIGGSYIMNLAKAAPERVAAAVMLQPIGLDNNRETFLELARGWQADVAGDHPEADAQAFEAFAAAMFGGDFMFSATRDDVRRCATPLLVLLGDDIYHPSSISREIAALAPSAELVTSWKEEPALSKASARIAAFLAENGA